ncbi:glycosyltransferase family 4 protein [Cochleicola gelatinilyticus]|uniref:Glycosyltransferase n=1 Tax=Cochleicola gelatinilyticus TaxID=1763537 RepID=A0A167K965_9FLAO|nr:glycosyltransferase family 4 protein [Cochleicola gelatinilyticus]OAB81521.1 glycosyltransferase [Cochleicola gelatinilyticus]
MKTLLIIGHTIPEPATTAAGGRMMQLIKLFSQNEYTIVFASTASISERSVNLDILGITYEAIQLNDPSFDVFISTLNPSVVLFDRFITEEQFGWRVAEHCPNALRILDTEDLHFLRKARAKAVKQGIPVSEADLYTDIAKRELASIFRCDVSLIISEFEIELLQKTFQVPFGILFYLPLLLDELTEDFIEQLPPFEARIDFMTIGNFLHAPNVDAVLELKNKIWPLIKRELPQATLQVFGAYAPQQIRELNNKKEGFLLKGWAEDAGHVFQSARVCLAPLRFGAGLKGKLLDAMQYGTPSVTTTVGAEGMCGIFPFNGSIKDEPYDFASEAIQLYTEKSKWIRAQKNGFDLIEKRFQKQLFSEKFIKKVIWLQGNLGAHRNSFFLGQVFQHHTLKSSKYLSRWIEAKNGR